VVRSGPPLVRTQPRYVHGLIAGVNHLAFKLPLTEVEKCIRQQPLVTRAERYLQQNEALLV
jgi:hypothetical protein